MMASGRTSAIAATGALALLASAVPAGATAGDAGDLRVLDAWIQGRQGGELAVYAKVRNVGTTPRDAAALSVDGAAIRCSTCRALAPGQTAVIGGWAPAQAGRPKRIAVSAEGPDVTPADNDGPLAPAIGLSAPNGATVPSGGIRLRAGLSMPGTLKLRATVAGLSFGRTLTFAEHGRRNLVLAPRRAADRARLRRALHGPHRPLALVTATDGGFPHRLWLKL